MLYIQGCHHRLLLYLREKKREKKPTKNSMHFENAICLIQMTQTNQIVIMSHNVIDHHWNFRVICSAVDI